MTIYCGLVFDSNSVRIIVYRWLTLLCVVGKRSCKDPYERVEPPSLFAPEHSYSDLRLLIRNLRLQSWNPLYAPDPNLPQPIGHGKGLQIQRK